MRLNLESFAANESELYNFEKFGEYDGPCLMLVGRNSFQFEIENSKRFYVDIFPNITND